MSKMKPAIVPFGIGQCKDSAMDGDAYELYRWLGWRELALRFLDSYNPKPERAIVIVNVIVEFDGHIPDDVPLRHHAHEFVRTADTIISQRGTPKINPVSEWIRRWCVSNFPEAL